MFDIIKILLIFGIGLILFYLLIRLGSFAIFKSKQDVKKHKED